MTATNDAEGLERFAERALPIVREKLGANQLACQLCGVNDWNLENSPAFVVLWDVDSGKKPAFNAPSVQGFPLAVLTCKNCGNTLFLNTLILGIDEPVERD